ncbi:MAG: anaerobic glycerol-3-phosphate dehydrogenase subunit A [Thermodesulfobacteriota bacterium]|nr:anaerobic glycerol-3-phosphate dehydrogenase subunit A [Thermodesulfobacteriota bacterium]
METDVLIIGGGATGTGLARDFALRGITALVLEKSDINAGASGSNHGLLHSGARYVSNDRESAAACRKEKEILKKTASLCIDPCGGLFIAVQGDDENYTADFPFLCAESQINCQPVPLEQAAEMEPALTRKTIAAFRVDDAAIDPFMLSLENMAHAETLGARILCHTEVVGMEKNASRITRVWLKNTLTGRLFFLSPREIVNASGAWAGQVAAMAGAQVNLRYSKGTLLVTQSRITNGVVNRLRPPSDGDILVPGGTISILGTTATQIHDPDNIHPSVKEVDIILDQGAQMIPVLKKTRFIRAYSGVRPLVCTAAEKKDDRGLSRGFSLIDHKKEHLENFTTITGGKLTTFRLMAEKTADLVCRKMGNTTPCSTAGTPLPAANAKKWTKPGFASRRWIHKDKKDRLLCECEIISTAAVDTMIDDVNNPSAKDRGACKVTCKPG